MFDSTAWCQTNLVDTQCLNTATGVLVKVTNDNGISVTFIPGEHWSELNKRFEKLT